MCPPPSFGRLPSTGGFPLRAGAIGLTLDKPGLTPRSDADAQAGIIAVTTCVAGGMDDAGLPNRVEE
jgi:hypothetical protein